MGWALPTWCVVGVSASLAGPTWPKLVHLGRLLVASFRVPLGAPLPGASVSVVQLAFVGSSASWSLTVGGVLVRRELCAPCSRQVNISPRGSTREEAPLVTHASVGGGLKGGPPFDTGSETGVSDEVRALCSFIFFKVPRVSRSGGSGTSVNAKRCFVVSMGATKCLATSLRNYFHPASLLSACILRSRLCVAAWMKRCRMEKEERLPTTAGRSRGQC